MIQHVLHRHQAGGALDPIVCEMVHTGIGYSVYHTCTTVVVYECSSEVYLRTSTAVLLCTIRTVAVKSGDMYNTRTRTVLVLPYTGFLEIIRTLQICIQEEVFVVFSP